MANDKALRNMYLKINLSIYMYTYVYPTITKAGNKNWKICTNVFHKPNNPQSVHSALYRWRLLLTTLTRPLGVHTGKARAVQSQSWEVHASFQGKMKFVCRLNGATWCWRFNFLSALFVHKQTNSNSRTQALPATAAGLRKFANIHTYICNYIYDATSRGPHSAPNKLRITVTLFTQINPAAHCWTNSWLG